MKRCDITRKILLFSVFCLFRWHCYGDDGVVSQTQHARNSVESSLYSEPNVNTVSLEEKVLLKQDVKENAASQVDSETPKHSDRQHKPSPKDPTPTVDKSTQIKPKIVHNVQSSTSPQSEKESKTKTPQNQFSSPKQDSTSHKKQDSQSTLDAGLTSGNVHQSSEEKKPDVYSETEDIKKKGQQATSVPDIQSSSVPVDKHIPSPVPSKVDKDAKSKPVSSEEEITLKPAAESDHKMKTEASYQAPDYLDQGGSTSEELLTQPESEVMPSFDEWKKKMLAEQGDGYKVSAPVPPGKKIASHKRRRNYASYECGAKIVASNVEAESTSRILNELVDEYMLNPCKAKIWFVIELCESIQVAQIELANFELFSSSPKTFALHWSDRFPTRDWTPLGTFSAQDQRVLQTFEVQQQGFGKFIKLEFLSYYGTEHYCPLSLVRVFGTSMVDEYEEMETADSHPVPDDEEDRLDAVSSEDVASSKNLFGSATEAVMSIVKKAAQVLGRDHKDEDAERQAEKKDAAKPCKSSDNEDLINCTDWNGTSGLMHSNASVTTDDFVKKTLRSSVYSIAHALLPYLQQCSICSAMPKVDDKQSHSEPVLICRFLQAALGPVLFGAVCHLYKDEEKDAEIKFIPIPSITPSVTKSFKEPLDVIDKQMTSGILKTTLDASLPLRSHNIPLPPSFIFDSASLVLTPNIIVSESTAHKESPTLQLHSSIQPTRSFDEDKEIPPEKITIQKSEQSPPSSDVTKSDTVPTVISSSQDEQTETKSVEEPVEKSDTLAETPGTLHTDPLPPTKVISVLETEEKTPEIQPQFATKITSAIEDFATKIPDFDDTSFPVPIVDISITVSEEFSEDTKQATEKPLDYSTLKNGQVDVAKDKSEQPLPSLKIDPVLVGSVITPPGQKESVFMRMGNRIKALELNMSLSSQYLQELSQRYRRQMEEMQKAFNRTIGTLNDTAKKAAERDLRQQEAIGQLQSQLANLTQAVGVLLDERDTMHKQMLETHICLMAVQAIIMITVLSLCVRRLTSQLPPRVDSDKVIVQDTVIPNSRTLIKRSSSFEGGIQPTSKKIKKRSNSEEIVTSRSNLMVVEPAVPIMAEPPPKVKKKHNRHKKNKGMQRSVSNPTLPMAAKKGSNSSLHSKADSESSAGVLFSHVGQQKTKPSNGGPVRHGHSCENCVKDHCTASASRVSPKAGDRDKERRAVAVPLQNLTNGVLHNGSLDDMDHEETCCKKFSLKKFLKIQKRDSV